MHHSIIGMQKIISDKVKCWRWKVKRRIGWLHRLRMLKECCLLMSRFTYSALCCALSQAEWWTLKSPHN